MLTIPVFELEDIPMRVNALGRLEFCKMRDEAVLASFAIGIKANADDDWEIVSLHLGTQELFGETFRRFANHLESEHAAKLADHVGEHIGDALESARADEREFVAGW